MKRSFQARYGQSPQCTWFAPGRVNIIGEHTDYNNGLALPIALSLGVRVQVARSTDGFSRVSSMQRRGDAVAARVEDLRPGCIDGWAGCAMGVLWALREEGCRATAVNVLIDGDVPVGAGLSSSAALGCAVAAAVNDLLDLRCNVDALIQVARRAENDFVGVPTGALDQTASMLCRDGHALFIDFRTMQTRLIPLDLARAGLELIVIDTRAPHRLVDGEYAARKDECALAAQLLGLGSLRDVALAELDDASDRLIDPILQRRVTHVVTENARVRESTWLLDAGQDPRQLGPLLTASHTSLREDYNVSCAELDLAVESVNAAGAHGARMTGGGFGGSAIALVDEADHASVAEAVRRAFGQASFTKPAIFAVQPAPGAHRVQE